MGEVEISMAATDRIKAILAEEPVSSAFRIGVEGGGCSGFKYAFSVVARPDDSDHFLEKDGARLVVDDTSLPFLLGAKIDFVDDLMGQSFRIENPNAASSCGCGVSFSV
ncbi:iron-sulfur cluster assembly accessory protein [Methylocystis bryophila]|uniref:Iron-sulfur cluster assembly accessory protein n=1 Tax=Methylocystis bryophila TaxID=655015 RepID=A0A1W6N1U0_9HYPH|nr:iron-sulfur cluster assembly accessory protein [Methylocystis bryophila]